MAAVPFLAGCSGGAATLPDVEQRSAVAAGLPAAIEFRRHPGPIDVMPPPSDQVNELSLDEAAWRALGHDPQVQVALARVRAALADAKQSRLLPNPVLSVAVRFPEGGGREVIEAGLSADLVALLRRPRQIRAADHRLGAAAGEALAVVLDRLAEVQERYAAVQALDAQVELLADQGRLLDRLLELARSRVAVGESSRLDVLTLDTQRARLESERLETEAQRHDQRLALARLLGRPSDEASWTLGPWQAPPSLALDERAWIAAALEHRPEVQVRRWELAALGDEASAAGWSILEGSEIGIDAEREEEWGVGPAAALPLPLFDWGQARREKLEAQRVEARHQLVHAQRQVVEDVRRALAALGASQRVLAHARDELIPVLERRHEQARDAYEAGLSGITEVLLAEQELQEARRRVLEMQQRVSLAQSRLHRAAGGPGVARASSPPPATRRAVATTPDQPNPDEEVR